MSSRVHKKMSPDRFDASFLQQETMCKLDFTVKSLSDVNRHSVIGKWKTTGYIFKTTVYISKTTGYISKTTGYISKTTGYISKTTGYISKTTGYISKTTVYISKTTVMSHISSVKYQTHVTCVELIRCRGWT